MEFVASRSRQALSNKYLIVTIGADAAESSRGLKLKVANGRQDGGRIPSDGECIA